MTTMEFWVSSCVWSSLWQAVWKGGRTRVEVCFVCLLAWFVLFCIVSNSSFARHFFSFPSRLQSVHHPIIAWCLHFRRRCGTIVGESLVSTRSEAGLQHACWALSTQQVRRRAASWWEAAVSRQPSQSACATDVRPRSLQY